MRANHPVEVARWTQAISRSIEWHQQTKNIQQSSDFGSTASFRPSDSTSIYTRSARLSKEYSKGSLLLGHSRRGSPPERFGSAAGEDGGADYLAEGRYASNEEEIGSEAGHAASLRSYEESYSSEHLVPPHQSTFILQGTSLQTQIDLTLQLLTLSVPPTSSPRAQELKSALTSSVHLISNMFMEYKQMTAEREAWYEKRWADEHARSIMWEDSLGIVVGESEGLERQLAKLRNQTKVMRKASKMMAVVIAENAAHGEEGEVPEGLATIKGHPALSKTSMVSPDPTSAPADTSRIPVVLEVTADCGQSIIPSSDTLLCPSASLTPELSTKDIDDDESDSTDEFFDAVDSNNLPNLTISTPLATALPCNIPDFLDPAQYQGYANPRQRLPISNDDRPPVSLWAVLKGSIGKDLTKISFPVYFNEPTSM